MMGKLKSWLGLEERATPENPDTPLTSSALLPVFGADPTHAGVRVSEKTALALAAVYACVRILSDTVASLPLVLFERLEPRGRRRAVEHKLYGVLHDRPNPETSAFRWRQTLQHHLLVWGNAYAEIETGGAGEIKALWPLLPDRTRIERVNGSRVVITRAQGREIRLPGEDVLHIPGLGFDGLRGYSPLAFYRQAAGLGLATEQTGAQYFGSGQRPGGVLEHPGTLTPGARANLRESWPAFHAGLDAQQRTAILEEGMTWKQVSITPEDSQFLETRKFQVAEIARIFRVPLHMLEELSQGASFASIEAKQIDFVRYSIQPWLQLWAEELGWQLLLPAERARLFLEFLTQAYLRGETDKRFEAYAKARQWGWMSANDIRELENLNPLGPEGDVYLQPLNMVPAGADLRLERSVSERRTLAGWIEGEEMLEGGSGGGVAAAHEPGPEFELRARRAVEARQRQREIYERLFSAAAGRLVRREVRTLERLLLQSFKDSSSGGMDRFRAGLRKFLDEFPPVVREELRPVAAAFAEALLVEIREELDFEDDIQPEMDAAVDSYVDGAAERHVASSENQLEAIMRDEAPEAVGEALGDRLREWGEKRAGKIGLLESVRSHGALTRAAFLAAGVVRIVWVALGSETCPLCRRMNGRTIKISGVFLAPGDKVEGDSKTPTLQAVGPIRYPPLHGGCVCGIARAA